MKHISRLRVHIADTTVGELGTDARGRTYFQYDSVWLKTGFDLSPGTLPFQAEPQQIPTEALTETVDIAQLAHSAEQLLQGETPEVLQQLQVQGGSPGGARPKVTVALSDQADECLSGFRSVPQGYAHWMVKFRAREDSPDMGRIELAYAKMAQRAGLAMPECDIETEEFETEMHDGKARLRKFTGSGK